MKVKNILAAVVALLAAYGLMKIFWWLLTAVFSVAVTLIQIIVLLILAIPLYIIVSRKFFD